MSLKARVILPVITLAAAAMLFACGGNETTPTSAPTSTPTAAPTATAAFASFQQTGTGTINVEYTPTPVPSATSTPKSVLEDIVVQCGSSPKNEVIFSVNGKEKWRSPVGTHMPDYSRRISGVTLPQSTFECVNPVDDAGHSSGPVYDSAHQMVFAHGQDSSALFPAELVKIDAKTGKEVSYLMHPGHIKGVVPIGKVDTPKGSIDVVVVTAVSNVGSLVNQASAATGKPQPYVPVAIAVNSDTMEVLGYLQLGNQGQPLFPSASNNNGVWTINYALNVDGKRMPAALTVNQLLTQSSMQLAESLTNSGLFK